MINRCKSNEWLLSIYRFVDITKNRSIFRTACKNSMMMFERVLNTSLRDMFNHMRSVLTWCNQSWISRICKYLNQASIYVLKAKNENIRKMCKIRSKLTIKIPKPCHTLLWCFHCCLWTSKCRLRIEI